MSTPNEIKKSYERALKAREHHYSNFNYWMNFYAITIGALFIGYYTIKDDAMLKLIVALSGFAASFAWLQSFRGYYHWIKQWMNVVRFHEEKYLESVNDSRNNNEKEFSIDNLRVYSLYYESEKERTRCILKSTNISTQKMTLRFIFTLSISWLVLLVPQIHELLGRFFCLTCSEDCKCGCKVMSSSCLAFVVVVFCLVVILVCVLLFCVHKGSDIDNHYRLKEKDGNFTVTPPDLSNNKSSNKK